MPYQITREYEYPIVVLRLTGQVDVDAINYMFNECAGEMQHINGLASLVVDFGDATLDSAHRFAQAVIIFHRTSSSFKPDAPIYYAFVGQRYSLDEVMEELEGMRFHAPTFKSVSEAISYLNLRVGSTYLRESRSHSDTRDIETLTIRRSDSSQGHFSGALPGTGEFPAGGVLRVTEVDTQRTMLLFPKDVLCIGRQESGFDKPDLDLSMWGAFHKGVSREHALIVRTGARLSVVDLGSTNGTYRNGVPLKPNDGELLHDGDEITFGSLAVRMYFQETIRIP